MTYYDILQIAPTASDEVVRVAYRSLAKKYHPDTCEGEPAYAEEKMQELNEAFAVLSDPEKRAEYDRMLEQASCKDMPRSSPQDAADTDTVIHEVVHGSSGGDTAQSTGCLGCFWNVAKVVFFILIACWIFTKLPSCSSSDSGN